MRKTLSLLLTAIIAAITLSACRELPLNGDLDAQWQVLSITYPDGTVTDPEGQRYYCFYRHTGHLTAPKGVKITANIIYKGNSLSMEFPGTRLLRLAPWGITAPDDVPAEKVGYICHFTINHLSSKTLVMTTDMGVVISCRKY